MGGAKRVEDLAAWQKGRELVREVYQVTSEGSLCKDLGLCDQLRRAAVSVPANIAEGFGRSSTREFARFLDIARGSAVEVQTLLYVALDVKHLPAEPFAKLYKTATDAVGMVSGLRAYLLRYKPPKQESSSNIEL